jgi:glycosyltransferase involved in cell wall biosynthesis
MRCTKDIMRGAGCNFYVSNALREESERIVSGISKEILYNGVSEGFDRFSDDVRRSLRYEYGLLPDEKVVAFVGNLVAVKNVRSLQQLFHDIRAAYDGPLKFWIVGDGKQRADVERDMASDESLDVRFWGNQPADMMPSIMNCIDVLVLPSLNEGLPLVCAEAIRCGASVVGSDAGGISEVIGKENTVPLGEGFVDELSAKAVGMLKVPVLQKIPSQLDWTATAAKELTYIKAL